MRKCGRMLHSRTGHRQQYGLCAFHAAYPTLQTHSLCICNTYFFNNGYTNVPQCYFIRTLSLLFKKVNQSRFRPGVAQRVPGS